MGTCHFTRREEHGPFGDVCTSKGGIKRGPANITVNFDVYVWDYINILLRISQWASSEATQYEM
jgi:hypothetical protein